MHTLSVHRCYHRRLQSALILIHAGPFSLPFAAMSGGVSGETGGKGAMSEGGGGGGG